MLFQKRFQPNAMCSFLAHQFIDCLNLSFNLKVSEKNQTIADGDYIQVDKGKFKPRYYANKMQFLGG